MTVPPWLWWVTYLVLPVIAALSVVARRTGWPGGETETNRGAKVRRSIALLLTFSASIVTFDFIRMLGDLNGLGALVFLGLLVSQVGLAATVIRATPARSEVAFAAVALATTVTMLLVRAQVIWIFG